ncbi:ATP-dependent rRNA helicase RRP3, putative [Plasmodium berghei]|uniref:ATP-dependent RNA helicase DDX47, putative n=2 Tax=Plasmodium berghei TaxID=5821 RepID=A0A509AHW3_PLABA|nr:ATP-dependent RNA helicase DDX47, putative [Plasmodium berghei ANKA]CXH96854.1 ATP-dependent rRNA helicase RRP3, putative [Plasmodium berghei]SCL91212.1 ATP-dependent rRNA helicase RRP3, putative [Plasmodium berghei]SCM15448.1 ATP-dependent rRNA helicase RRP3, putative [Plasmodium berghei]SCM17244.1 ATP-dependent rRNA helicase RRP3, putative [Plasmodium berghei]SCN22352.1 ATP-dependent rRNA helicase RRP3, putative [Plasmodium berghei]|eukprot:XP_034420034.1 ATP-dependent RNA helicase DDX47, putative [Plasmodium berghei ANKA]
MKHHNINDVLKNFDKKLNKNYKILKEMDIQNMQNEYEEKLKEKNKIKNKLINKKNKSNQDEPINNDSNQSELEHNPLDHENEQNQDSETKEITSFSQLNICEEILQSIQELGWEKPTLIQQKVLPLMFQKRDIIGLSETGSGKTACFIIPILQELKLKKQNFFALIISPTRELCIQIAQNAQALGSNLLINICTIFGGVDIVTQSLNLAKKPNIIISTPGRILDHLNNTKGFNLKNLKYLVFDEADKLLSLDFESSINKLLLILPKNRITFLFSATMTKSVAKLKKTSLKNPIKIEVSNKYSTVKTLIENYIFLPLKYKYTYLCSLCFYYTNKNIIIFSNTCATAQKLNFFCRNLGLKSICLHGKLTQNQRLSSLNLFKTNKYNILISTQVGARGLDLQNIKIVINFDLCSCKEYIHRVGRTARAGKTGKSITFVTQYDVETFLTIEKQLNKKIDKFTDIDEHDVLVYHNQALEALRLSEIEMKENQELYKKNKFKKKK